MNFSSNIKSKTSFLNQTIYALKFWLNQDSFLNRSFFNWDFTVVLVRGQSTYIHTYSDYDSNWAIYSPIIIGCDIIFDMHFLHNGVRQKSSQKLRQILTFPNVYIFMTCNIEYNQKSMPCFLKCQEIQTYKGYREGNLKKFILFTCNLLTPKQLLCIP